MGCCSVKPVEIEILTESASDHSNITPNLSFADISLRSKDDEPNKITQAEVLPIQITQRSRSISCNHSMYSNPIEKAFLMTSPHKFNCIVSASYNFKQNCLKSGISNTGRNVGLSNDSMDQ